MKRKSGWAIYQQKHRLHAGDHVLLGGYELQIWRESARLSEIEDLKAKQEEYHAKQLADPQWISFMERHPDQVFEYVYRIQKITRTKDYKPYISYRLLRRKK